MATAPTPPAGPDAAPRFTLLDHLRRLLPGSWRGALNRGLYEAAYRIPSVARAGFFNGGYRPLSPRLLAVPALAATPSQANLYHFVLREHTAGLLWEPLAMLDIGCGAGGGLRYAAALWPRSRLTGVDASPSAIAAARRALAGLPGIELIRARGEALPLPDAGFDLVASIGTLTNVGAEPFMAEAARVLAPGGVLTLSAGTGWSAPDYRRMLAEAAGRAGLELLRFTDLTPGVMAAMREDQAALAEAVARLPRFLRPQAREWTALPGSARHARYVAGARRDFAAVFRHAG